MNTDKPAPKKDWPRMGVNPKNGNRARFDCAADMPPGWVLEKPLPGAAVAPGPAAAPVDGDIAALRAAYKADFGKAPFNGWDAATLRQKIAERP